jgi:hypothetical protein
MTTEHPKSSYRYQPALPKVLHLLRKCTKCGMGRLLATIARIPEVPQGGNDIEQCCLFCPSSCKDYRFNLLYLLYLNLRTQISALQRAGRGAS